MCNYRGQSGDGQSGGGLRDGRKRLKKYKLVVVDRGSLGWGARHSERSPQECNGYVQSRREDRVIRGIVSQTIKMFIQGNVYPKLIIK